MKSAAAPGGQRGAVLLAVVLLVAIEAAMAAALAKQTWSATAELRARRDVLCARYAALGGLALAAPSSGSDAASLVGPAVVRLDVSRLQLSSTWCVLRAAASCGQASRTIDRTLADASACSATPP